MFDDHGNGYVSERPPPQHAERRCALSARCVALVTEHLRHLLPVFAAKICRVELQQESVESFRDIHG
jgi:hypothetical protein